MIWDRKTAINHQAVGGNVTLHWLLGIHLVYCAAAVSHFMLWHVEDDWYALKFTEATEKVHIFFKFNRKFVFFSFLYESVTLKFVQIVHMELYCILKERTRSHLDQAVKLFIQQGITNIYITPLCCLHTLSVSTNRCKQMQPSSSHFPKWLTHSRDKSFSLTYFHLLWKTLLEELGKTTMPG